MRVEKSHLLYSPRDLCAALAAYFLCTGLRIINRETLPNLSVFFILSNRRLWYNITLPLMGVNRKSVIYQNAFFIILNSPFSSRVYRLFLCIPHTLQDLSYIHYNWYFSHNFSILSHFQASLPITMLMRSVVFLHYEPYTKIIS